jgi:hypothetical protein
MRKLSLFCTALIVLTLVAAPLVAATGKKTHDVNVTVVSLDEKAKTLTFKTDTGEEKTAPVVGQAINKLKTVHPGEQITVTCTDKETGEHEAISDIKAAKTDKG